MNRRRAERPSSLTFRQLTCCRMLFIRNLTLLSSAQTPVVHTIGQQLRELSRRDNLVIHGLRVRHHETPSQTGGRAFFHGFKGEFACEVRLLHPADYRPKQKRSGGGLVEVRARGSDK